MSHMMHDDAVWRALADPTRRALLDRLRDGPCTTGALAAYFPVTRFAVMKHLDVLVEAGLVLVERRGRERLNYLNRAPLRRTYEGWMAPYVQSAPRSPAARSAAASTPATIGTLGDTMSTHPVLSEAVDVRTQVRVEVPRQTVYTALLEIGDWWPHRSRPGSYVVLEPHVGGRFYEDWRTGGTLYGTVTEIVDDTRIRVHGPMGIRSALAGSLTIELADVDDGAAALVALTHIAVGPIPQSTAAEYRVGWEAVLAALRTHVAART